MEWTPPSSESMLPLPLAVVSVLSLRKLLTATKEFQNLSDSSRNLLLSYINSAATACVGAMIKSTKGKQVGTWKCWKTFLYQIGFENKVSLDGLTQFQRNILVSTFAQAYCQGSFPPQNTEHLAEGSVSVPIVSYVTQACQANNRQYPRLDADSKTCFLLQEQFGGCHNQDGLKNKQKVLLMVVLHKNE